EEHSIIGGLGSAVAEVLSEEYPVKVKRIGIKDQFGQSGSPKELLKHYGLTAEDIVKAAMSF
ncbi:transketolase C-terminal domain-containing protein, partial [Thermoanaerobacter pentosaceus]